MRYILTFALCLGCTSAAAAPSFKDPEATLSFGYAKLKATELVYDNGLLLSRLNWSSEAPTVTAAFSSHFGEGWTLSASATTALVAGGFMSDYDWFLADPKVQHIWTDRSLHADTDLNHYYTGELTLGRDVAVRDDMVVNFHGGIKYTSAKWTAKGGSYVYSSDNGFRDEVGNFPGGERGISYQQRIPTLFVGAKTDWTSGNWTVSGQVRAGASLFAQATDHHWTRNTRFDERYKVNPYLGATATAAYTMGDRGSVVLSASYDKYFRTKGSNEFVDPEKNELVATGKNSVGLDLSALAVSAGYQFRF